MTVEHVVKRPLRADAVRNQARILQAAREVFGKRGLEASLDDVARHAGLGIATLYRRFPDRESLIVAMFEMDLKKAVEHARAALVSPDPWTGFTELLKAIFSTVAEDRGMRQVMLSSRYGLHAAAAYRLELIGLIDRVVRRAQAHGSLRPGITAHDIPPLILMVGVVADFGLKASPGLWERYAALLIDGLSTATASAALIPGPLSQAGMALAMSTWEF